jgi:cell division protein FtsI (penicillin-binding protein 3)
LFTIQVKDKSYYEALAKKQHLSRTVLNPIRGMIYDRHLDILATNSIKYSFSVNPRDLSKETKVRLANLFSKVFGKTTNYYQEKFNSKKYFVWVENEITENQAEPILRSQEKDIYIHKIPKRFYPRKELAGQVIGYTDTDNLGQSGIEKTFNSILSGEPGFLIEQNDGWGRSLPSLEYPEKKAINGSNLVLTIDAQFQAIAQEELVKAILEKKADGGMCVIMNPKTGAVLAMVSYPQIDPNNSKSFSQEALKIITITDIFNSNSVAGTR